MAILMPYLLQDGLAIGFGQDGLGIGRGLILKI
jgi:hypothetical protein